MRGSSIETSGTTRDAVDRRDVVCCLAIFSLTTLYLSFWPRDLTAFDEGLFLYEAKRILDGDVIYRDFFEIITPSSLYVMALLFKVFGTSMATARIGMSVLHGMIAVAMYLICRRTGVRTVVALVAAIAHPAVCYPALSIASAHWMGTFLALLALLFALRRPIHSAGRAWGLGLILALLVSVQQQKGAILTLGGALLVLVDGWLRPRAAPSLVTTLAAYAAGCLTISLPLAAALLWFAGIDPVYAALIHFPLVYYPQFHRHITWGYYVWAAPQLYVFPRLIKYLPAAIPFAACRVAWRWWRRGERGEVRGPFVLILFAAFTILSIFYNADYTHLAVTAPVWLLVVAETFEWALRGLERYRGFRHAGAIACAALLLALGWRLERNPVARRQIFSHPHDTLFGRIDFADAEEIVLIDTLRALLEQSPSKEMFSFPAYASLYLLVGGSNPTPYQLLLQNYSAPEHWTKTIEILEHRKVPFVVLTRVWVNTKVDPVAQYLKDHYRRVKLPSTNRPNLYFLYQRKPEAGDAAPAPPSQQGAQAARLAASRGRCA
jgi:hypothetical protein